MHATKADVLSILKTCDDPELGIDVVNLGLIYDVTFSAEVVTITMTLTTPGCPLVPYFREEVVRKVKTGTGAKDVLIELTFEPPWDPSKMSADARTMLSMMR
ncbi:MAG: metal-sulfur cluster assembly factor [Candidatus Kerfeldbacteria bacterium]|nr:metal-sulfur cluster assembly factor [Candidatus Kerfeldbacteria bacterium]